MLKGERASTDRRTNRTRRLIAEALIALMVERRYDRITVQEIIDRADVGRSTFYAHYRDREDLLVSESERVLALFYQHLEAGDRDTQQLLPNLQLFRHVDEQYHLYEALVRGHGIGLIYETAHRYLVESVVQRLNSQVKRGVASSIPLPILADYVAGTCLNLLRWWLEHGRPYSAERMDAIFQALVLPAIREALSSSVEVTEGA